MDLNQRQANEFVYKALDEIAEIKNPYIKIISDNKGGTSYRLIYTSYLKNIEKMSIYDLTKKDFNKLLIRGLKLSNYELL